MNNVDLSGYLHRAPQIVRRAALALLFTLTVGYTVGLRYLYITSDFNATGVEENYLGNEEDEEAEVMKFKMPEAKLLTIIHTHILSYAFIFSLLTILLLISGIHPKIKNFLILEPFILVVLNFGLLYLLWMGCTWLGPVIMITGIILTLSFYLSVILLTKDILISKK